ncbi:hypothetical protein DNTS_007999 [Danionella cerebrum]|uniref:Large proline-rich protein BAG6 n=1 Tax=Danionella cerebrum TaxID=2873325 RepID=A0A553NML1_9TELE|nr:hypothetical protein DNTS_007999 [Danionella translucida]
MEEPGSIAVTVKTLDSQSRTFSVRGEWTVKQFKEHIAASVEIPVDKQRLIYQGKVLQDERTLAEYNVDGKVIHLVERVPPQTSQSGGGDGGVSSSSGAADGGSTSSQSSTFPGASHDRNANNYVMLGTFNLPVNIMDPQQIQMSVQQVLAGVGEMGHNVRVSTASGSSGSVDVHINMDQSVESEPRRRLQLVESLLRETRTLIHRLEGETSEPSHQETSPPSSSFSEPPVNSSSSAPPSSSFRPEETTRSGPSHPTPLELVEVMSEVRRVEERLRPFMERTHSILGAASSADYNNNTQEREEDQRTLNLIGESLHLLGSTLVALSDLRCNLSAQPPRHLHVVRQLSSSSVMLHSRLPHIPITMNLGSTSNLASNRRPSSDGPTHPSESSNQSDQQVQTAPNGSSQPTTHGQGTPRLIRITHQTMEPVVMMQMNLDESDSGEQGQGQQNPSTVGETGTTASMNVPGLPPEFMQAIMNQLSQQAFAMAAAASGANQGQPQSGDGSAPLQPQARVLITRPSVSSHVPLTQPMGTGGGTANLQAAAAEVSEPQNNQGIPSPLTQMVSGMVGQLLMPMHTANTSGQTSTHTTSTASMGQAQEGSPGDNLAQMLGSLLGGTAGGGGVSGAPPSITVTVPGVPAFIQGLSEFIQSGQPVFPLPNQQPPPSQATAPATSQPNRAAATPHPPNEAGESLSPELFTGIVQGVLSTMMGSLGTGHGNTESIAQFIQRLSQTSNLFTPGAGDASFSMVDMVLLLHGNSQPLSRIQPQLTAFFTEHYLQGQEPTDANIARAAEDRINELEEYIAESFSTVSVREGVDIIQTNLHFLRQQFTCMATHILRCTDNTFGQRLLYLCTQGLFECLALNLYCLRGEQRALTTVINHRIRRMSAEVNPSLVNWLTSMMSMRLHLILDHNPITEDQIQHYVMHTQMEEGQSPATTAEEVMVFPGEVSDREEPPSSHEVQGAIAFSARDAEVSTEEPEPWAAAVPPEWVPIIRNDMLAQRKIKTQPPLSDAYLNGMPAKRRKTAHGECPQLSLAEAVSRAARTAGVQPLTAPDSLKGELESQEVQEAYAQQVKCDIKKRLQDDPDYNQQRFPNTHRAFSEDT